MEDGLPVLSLQFTTSSRKYLTANVHTEDWLPFGSDHFIEKKLSLDIIFKRFNILSTRSLNDILSRALKRKELEQSLNHSRR